MHDIAEFLGGRDPFSGLDEADLEALASRTEVEFFRAGTTIYAEGAAPANRMWVVRRGAAELLEDGRVVDRLEEGELFGQPLGLSVDPARLEARAAEDTLAYSLPSSEVSPLLGGVPRASTHEGDATSAPASALVREPALVIEAGSSLREAAQAMADRRVSAALVRVAERSLGILTDRDLRSRVVAMGLPPETPVTEVMTAPVIAVGADTPGAEVLQTMLEHDVHHLPVLSERSELIGVIDGADLLAAERRGPFLLRRAVAEADSRAELERAASQLPSAVIAMHRARTSPLRLTGAISAIADALIRRAIELTGADLDEPPAEFAWLALGSHGRREPAPSSDVDSGMAWRDPASGDAAGEAVMGYMRAIATGVGDCMKEVGWKLDPHGVTATGQFSASSVRDWEAAIHDWLERQTDERVALAISITMDARVVCGPTELDPRTFLLQERHRSLLLRSMLRAAIATRPPTGFLRDLVVEHGGEHRGTLDIKAGGLSPVVNLARVAALEAETKATSTIARLDAAREAGTLEPDRARSLKHAFELFTELRLEHQVRQLEGGGQPDDHLDPRTLDPLTRRYLRDAFREVAAIQRAMAVKLDLGRGRI